ncbi:MAG: hypothetical protein QM820_08100 [Minicystis sp.]
MAAFIVAIGIVVLHAFATAVLWFEFRSRERRSIERIERATAAILEAIGVLRGELARHGLAGGGASTLPSEAGRAPVKRSVVIHDKRTGRPLDALDARYEALRAAAEREGKPTAHCHGPECFTGAPSVDICSCSCEGCTRATDLLLQAQDEITGP